MDLLINTAWAAEGGPPGSAFSPLIMLALFFVVFYFLLIRPQQKRAKDHAAMIGAVSSGEEAVTAGGLLGKVTEVGDDYLSLEIANGTVVKVQKNTIAKMLPKGTIKNA